MFWRLLILEQTRMLVLQGFAKAMLDVADNLERAIGIVDSRSEDTEELDLEKVQALLTSLHDGVKLTDKILVQVRPCCSGATEPCTCPAQCAV